MGRDESVFDGKTLDDAVRKGLSDLGLTRAEVMITVLEEGSGGFLGFGSRPYRVRVIPRPGGAIREPDDRGSDRSRGPRGRDRDRGRGRDRDRGRGREDRGARVEARGPREAGRSDRPARGETRPAARDDKRERAGARGPRRNERGDRPPRSDRPQRADAARTESRPQPAPRREELPEQTASPGGRPPMDADGGRRRRRRRGGRGRGPGEEAAASSAPGAAFEHESDRSMAEASADFVRADERTPEHAEEHATVGREDHGERGDEDRGDRGSEGRVEWAREDRDERGSEDRDERGSEDRGERGGEERGERGREDRGERGREDRGERGGEERGEGRREMRREPQGDEMPGPELEREATRLTGELLTRMGYQAEVSAHADGTRVDVRALVPEGGDDLTGPKGEVRQALQHILNRMLNRGGGSTYHLQLEVNDFWERREFELQELARRLAEDALSADGEVVTEYLNAQERRIVHVTLKTDARVKTYALGTGLIKRVAIAPADYPEPEAGEE